MYIHFFKRLIDILIGLCALPYLVQYLLYLKEIKI